MKSAKLPPTLEELRAYFKEKDVPETEAEKFLAHHNARNWINESGNAYSDWKRPAYKWVKRIRFANRLF